ncbi:YciI family protein [Thioalkalivibrio sp. ALJ16]|uniref:YciI family protein n=1 Tax=Thioalkalivibrio sp. ALJ16 TaxID=1158762 RepID=UPI000364C914|nr:YciI family protein [Thioalkalivibrio sp. ALJ16]
MLYMIQGQDVPESLDARLAARPEHLARLQNLRDDGRLILAGPCPAIDSDDPGPAGFTGSLIVAEFPSLEAARAWADADPYVAAGVYARVDVRPFKQVF